MLAERYPRVIAPYKDFSTEGFTLTVFEELTLCIVISLLVVLTGNKAVSYLWLGAFIGCALHFAFHIVQAAALKMYIPAITSIICLPLSVWIILKCLSTIRRTSVVPVFRIAAGMALVAIN
ncbi:MAG TPA: HXXEE domain-containing protein [Thermoclostridium caenicola]|nr:HXXEE domain-containing protein [Thermoclostridium caenicola]